MILALIAMACAPQPSPSSALPASSTARSGESAADRQPRILTLALGREPSALNAKLNSGSGVEEARWIFSGYLAGVDKFGRAHPMLAEELPSLEDRSWMVKADGTMETTWRVRSSAHWHDGVPLSSRDFVLAWRVYNDPEFPGQPVQIERLMSAVEPVDARTFVVRWRQVYAFANVLSAPHLEAIPSHLLEALYLTDKPAFINGRHWTTEYIGSGPFRVDQWEPGSQSMSLLAHDSFALGRPKIDRLHVQFISDTRAAVAGLLAGTLDMALAPTRRG